MHIRKSFSIPRFGTLILCFTAAAAAAYLMGDTLPAPRLFCMPAGTTMTAPAVECALWLAVSLTTCAMPLFAALTIFRGICFGLTLSLLTTGILTAPDPLPLYTYAAVTLLLCTYAAAGNRAVLRFLPCAGMVFGVSMIG